MGAAGLAALATSVTLVCCVLPALLVSVGLGAVMAGAFTLWPELAWLGRNKNWVFGGAGFILVLAGGMLWHARGLPCPIDPVQAKACMNLRRLSVTIWTVSLGLYALSAFFAFFAADLFFGA
jgi:hypothetical protein